MKKNKKKLYQLAGTRPKKVSQPKKVQNRFLMVHFQEIK
jgi:hypothetical protein